MAIPDPDLVALAEPALGQYFLTNPDTIAQLITAAAIGPNDYVLEAGAGIGTVARHIPPCRQLTVVELDERLIPHLTNAVPHANVIHGDALNIITTHRVDVLLSNLPHRVTDQLLTILPSLAIPTAILSVDPATDLSPLTRTHTINTLTTTKGTDYHPPQPATSRLIHLTTHTPTP